MFAMLLFFSGTAEKIGAFVLKVLAVAGGFVVGYLVGALLAWGLDRWAFKKQSPEVARKGIRVLLAIAGAIIVALIVFGEGGEGGPGGTGLMPGGGGNNPDTPPSVIPQPKPPVATPPNPKETTPEPIKPPVPIPGRKELTVTFLGGSDVGSGGRAYLLGTSPEKVTFDQLKAGIAEARKEAGAKGMFLVFGRTGADPIARNSANVTAVEVWAREQKIEFHWADDAPPKK